MQPLITSTSMYHPLELAIEDNISPGEGDTYRKPFQPEYHYMAYSSPPPRSSSPPSTPYSSRRDSGYAYIRSSPDVAVDLWYRQQPVDIWRLPTQASNSWLSSPYTSGTSIRERCFSPGHGFQKNPYRQVSSSDDRSDDAPSDTDEDMEDISGITCDSGSNRTTFFHTSAERGLWRSDPKPLMKTTSSTRHERKSVPTLSRVPTPLPLTTRTVSEPAPSSILQMSAFYPEKEFERTTELAVSAVEATGLQATPSVDLRPDTLLSSPQSLITDISSEMNIEFDPSDLVSSPLPPSSPPLSPLSRSISIISRSSSPLSFTFERSSSPLSELPDDYDNEEIRVSDAETLDSNNVPGMQVAEQTIATLSLKTEDDTEELEHASELQTSCRYLAQTEQALGPSKPQLSLLPCSDGLLVFSPVPTLSREDVALDPIDFDEAFRPTSGPAVVTTSGSFLQVANAEMVEDLDTEVTLESTVTATEGPDDDSNTHRSSRSLETSSALKDKNGIHRASGGAEPSTSRASQKAGELGKGEQNSAGRAKKQSDVKFRDDVNVKKVVGKKRMDRDDEENDERSSVAGSKRKRLKRTDGDIVASRPTKSISKPKRRVPLPSTNDEDEIVEPLDTEAQELHSTICGLVIETMATSRASSLSASAIFKLVMTSQPYLKSQRSERDWLRIFERVLRDGAADRGSGVFGRVESSGKDGSNRPLEAQWFYVPEKDEDQDRAALIRSMMPRPGKRTETMKYKQYYWRPLGKISKWDSEDAL